MMELILSYLSYRYESYIEIQAWIKINIIQIGLYVMLVFLPVV